MQRTGHAKVDGKSKRTSTWVMQEPQVLASTGGPQTAQPQGDQDRKPCDFNDLLTQTVRILHKAVESSQGRRRNTFLRGHVDGEWQPSFSTLRSSKLRNNQDATQKRSLGRVCKSDTWVCRSDTRNNGPSDMHKK
jgi:hypothetical protein